ncbi:MAG TPA: hypothetical protein PLH07_07555 [Sulfurovum sp.]|nr:MAG: hypothetical protein B7Y13_03935 [Sulfurovum sp. 24-42-9]OZA42779.1 MAG: hypothetical protein B7X80_09995 [Sulfurovum sp. 17-42-90]HQS72785.1 hypothetical protein [Sulfurovum sp.]HQS77834.1 hypothetical protein [Sulfurovum sp.]HQT29138.1 hypothetical protein [Sulfurovum sp.]
MDKSLLIFIAIGVGFLYFTTHFIGGIQEDDKFQSEDYKKKHQFDHFQAVDSIGRQILDVTGSTPDIQMQAWNSSPLKKELLALFPDFSGMKTYIGERVRGEALKVKLVNAVNEAEGKYFSGTMDAEEVKRTLDTLK